MCTPLPAECRQLTRCFGVDAVGQVGVLLCRIHCRVGSTVNDNVSGAEHERLARGKYRWVGEIAVPARVRY